MKRRKAFAVLALVGGLAVGIRAQQQSDTSKAKPKVPLVSVVGCAGRMPDGTWMLTSATSGIETDHQFTSVKEIEEAKKIALGTNRYKLVGTAEFVTKEELLKTQQRAEFTRPEVANATGELQSGRKVAVKGLLITTANEKTLNLASVQRLADTCK